MSDIPERLVCGICQMVQEFPHDHRTDLSGLDDGPPLDRERKRPTPKSAVQMKDIRARAWATRRRKYGEHGHR